FLATRGFTRTPAFESALEYLRPGLDRGTLAVVQTAVKHQGTGWDFTIDELRRYYERVVARVDVAPLLPAQPASPALPASPAPPPFFASLERWYLSTATTLGRRIAELHLTLASGTDPAFVPEPIDRTALGDGARGM